MLMVPASIAPENQYAKSFAAVLCLVVSADFEFNSDEFKGACEFIESDAFLRETNLTTRTLEFFKSYCKGIKEVMSVDNIDFPTVQTELIAEVRNVPEQYKSSLQNLINTLIPVCSHIEAQVLRRINL